MKKIIAFGASSSIHSINKKLATYAASCVPNAQATVLDLNDYEMPIFSVDRQNKDGFPQLVHDFKDLLMSADGIIISFAEHNSSYTAAFKNIFDWISRFDGDIWYSKPMLLLATNDGDRGAKTVLEQANNRIERKNPYDVPHFSLPNFSKTFDQNKGFLESTLEAQFQNALSIFVGQL
jgi:NAD(P)H-dependent FMN reductase